MQTTSKPPRTTSEALDTKLRGAEAVVCKELLDCGHPSEMNNLIDGKCGTCLTASKLEEIAEMNGGKIAESCLALAKIFRTGDVVCDRKGKSLLEWEKHFKKQPNESS